MPTIIFVHDEKKNVPCVQTCSNMLYIYVNKHTKENSLAHYVLTALMNGGVFSKPYKIPIGGDLYLSGYLLKGLIHFTEMSVRLNCR